MPKNSPTPSQNASSEPAQFDALRLARTIAARRTALGWSTRVLAERAGISQSYVVALERPAADGASRTPVPTIAVIARLAHALGMEPLDLAAIALRPAPRHVLLVVDDSERCPLERARSASRPHLPETWVWSASDAAPADGTNVVPIDLRRDRSVHYRPSRVSAALRRELAARRDDLGDRTIGLVFADTSRTMEGLDEPTPVLDFEHHWHDEVNTAAAAVGAHPTWNVCVYERRALAALADPAGAVADLLASHDDAWFARGATVTSGRAGAEAILTCLRPATGRRGPSPVLGRAVVATP